MQIDNLNEYGYDEDENGPKFIINLGGTILHPTYSTKLTIENISDELGPRLDNYLGSILFLIRLPRLCKSSLPQFTRGHRVALRL